MPNPCLLGGLDRIGVSEGLKKLAVFMWREGSVLPGPCQMNLEFVT